MKKSLVTLGVLVLFCVFYFLAIYPVAIAWLDESPFEGVRIPVEERSDLGPQEYLSTWEVADPEKRMRGAVKALNMSWDGNLCEGFLR